MVILPLILAFALAIGQTNGYQARCSCGSTSPTPQCVSCDYAPNCKHVTPLEAPEPASLRARSGPVFTTSLRNTSRASTVNSICSTVVNAGQNVFLQFRTIVDNTGRVQIRKYLTTDVDRSPGKYILVGVTNSIGGGITVKYEYFINQIRCKNYQITGFYTCKVFKCCVSTNDYIYGYDNLFTLSTCGKPPSGCLSQTEAQLVASNDFNTTGFYNPPYSAPFKCVCSFNGVDVINRAPHNTALRTGRTMKSRHPFLKRKVEIPKGKEMDVQNIHNWLTHQPHLPKLSDEHVLLFLHSCYYSGERTKETIDNYFTVRAQCPDLFTGWQWNKLEELWSTAYVMAPLPKNTPEGYRVLMYRLHDTDPAKFNLQEALKAFFSYNDVRISEDGLVEGYIVIFDMKGCSLGHLARVSTCMNLVKKFMVYIQDCHPVRLKGVHVINTASFIDSCLALVKPLMQTGLIQLLHLHSDLSTLEKFVPLELLPSDYSGMAPDIMSLHENHIEMVGKNYKDWLKESEKLAADMKKRISKPKNQIIELEGSFKTLEID